MPRGTTRYYPHTTLYSGLTLNLVCHRSAHGERILLITNPSNRYWHCMDSGGLLRRRLLV